MIFSETRLLGAFVIVPERIDDHRGFFARVFSQSEFEAHGLESAFVEANLSYNRWRGTIRGLHYQEPPFGEDKLFRCIRGSFLDVIIDLRPDSPTYKEWISVELSADNRRMLYVPKGFANGYQALEDDTEALYMVSQSYVPEAERGIRWNDSTFDIVWPEPEDVVVSEKDSRWPNFAE
jgi:dTDP-4-dehydrorhamnose 3,5-epimerase